MKKMMKKNNKGFSLVELIVVVLIMGIIAVALAPQVMKWVGTARTNSDSNTAKDIKNAVQVAVAEAQSQNTSIVTASKGVALTSANLTSAKFGGGVNCLINVLGGECPTTSAGGNFTVTVDAQGKVSVTY